MWCNVGFASEWQVSFKDTISNSQNVEYSCTLSQSEDKIVKKIGFIYLRQNPNNKYEITFLPISYNSLESITETLVTKSKTSDQTSGPQYDVLDWYGIDNKFPHLKEFGSKYISEYAFLFDFNKDSLGGTLFETLYFIDEDQFKILYSDLGYIKEEYTTGTINSFSQSIGDYGWRLSEMTRTYKKFDRRQLSYDCNKL